jgi:filamentous hemagglutinin
VGKDVTIDAAVGTRETTQGSTQQSSGLSVGLGGAVAQAANGVMASAQRARDVSDDRLAALHAAQAAYGVKDAASALGAGGLQGATPDNPNGLSLQLGIGASSASSRTQTYDEQAFGSRISSAGHVTITATGGDLNLIGSHVGRKC